jgi:hypothetical protein
MALVTPDGGASSVSLNGLSTTFITNKVIMEAPGLPDSLVNSKLSDVIREFYTNSGAWRERIGPYTIKNGVANLMVNPVDQYSQFQYVLEAHIYPSTPGGNQKQPLRPTPTPLQGNDTGMPLWYWMDTPSSMNFYPIPNANFSLYVYGILLPLINTPRLPDISTTHHLDALMWGTLARLYAMPGKPWTNAKAAQEYRREYNREMLRWRDVANRGYTNAIPRWRFPNFAGRNNHGTSVWGVRG